MPEGALREREVHCWFARTDSGAFADFRTLLSPEEATRLNQYRQPQARLNFLVGRGMARSLLSRYTGVGPREWDFTFNPYGRPEILAPADFPPLRFNLAHTRGLVVCAVAIGRQVGVDVEYTQRPVATLQLARRFFAADEVRTIEATEEGLRRDLFFRYWTLKEAYIKARGSGIFVIPLDGFSFHGGTPAADTIEFATALEDNPERWQFARFRPTLAHAVAVAVPRAAGESVEVHLREFRPPGNSR